MKKAADIDLEDITQIMLKSAYIGFENFAEFNPSSINDLDKEPEREENDSQEIFTIMIKDANSLRQKDDSCGHKLCH